MRSRTDAASQILDFPCLDHRNQLKNRGDRSLGLAPSRVLAHRTPQAQLASKKADSRPGSLSTRAFRSVPGVSVQLIFRAFLGPAGVH
jgi:hypothetical protein